MNLIKEASYKIFNEYSGGGLLLKEAAETCYRHVSQKTVDQYVLMLKNNKHYAMLEFCWYVIEIPSSEITMYDYNNIVNYYSSKKYLNCSIGNTGLIVSGNGRAWLEVFEEELGESVNESICFQLKQINPSLFDFFCTKKIHINVLTKEEVQLNLTDFNGISKLAKKSDTEKHDWIAVKFENVSRGFTHQIVRHRVMSFAQVSTRWVPMKDFGFVIDGSPINNPVDFKKIEDCVNHIQETYNYLLHRGHKRDIIRQILPIGTAGEIFVAGTVENWKKLFELRTASNAHWEIQIVMNDLRDELNSLGYNF